MRIIGGKFKGRKLVDCLRFITLKPTTGKSREALFNILQSGKFLKNSDFNIQNCNFLDACCGSGAVGIEAISRGANKTVFVDINSEHIKIVQKNISNLKIENQTQVINRDINSFSESKDEFDLVFLDPPYNSNYQKMIRNLIKNSVVIKKTILVVEGEVGHMQSISKILEQNFTEIEKRIYSKTFLGFYKMF